MDVKKIYLCDFTHTAQGIASDYIPYGIACIKSYFHEHSKNGDKVEIKLFKYPDKFVEAFLKNKPNIVGFSNYTWNTDLSHTFAEEVKRRYPDIPIFFGGPDYPLDDKAREKWLQKHPAVDIYIVGEAEESFQKCIDLLYETGDIQKVKMSSVEGVHSIVEGKLHKTSEVVPRLNNLDVIPSPYLKGYLDEFLKDDNLIPLIQTDRGCPYSCTYCDKGSKIWNKIDKKSPTIFETEIRYIGQRSTSKVINLAINNFGLLEQDLEIAKILKRTRDEIGYPLHVGTTTDKNFNKNIIEIVKILGENIPITASVQSLDPEVLENVKRRNLPLDKFIELSNLANSTNSNTRSEVIVGLPGDTKEKYIKTMSQLMDSKIQFILTFTLMLLEGSELNREESRNKWNLKTKYRLNHHCFGTYKFGDKELKTAETEEVGIGSDSMSFEDYLKCREFGLTVFLFYSDDLLYELLNFLNNFGIKSSEFISAIHNKKENYFTKELNELYQSFNDATKNELWEDREELESYTKSYDSKKQSKIIGYNVLYKHKAIAFMNLIENMIDAAFKVAKDLLDKNVLDEHSNYLKELKRYIVLRKKNMFSYDEVYEEEFNYDFCEFSKNNFQDLPKRLDKPIKIKFYHSEEQKRQFDGFSNDIEGAIRIIPKLALVNLIRSMKCKKNTMKDKRVLITGASGGIGSCIAKEFLKLGAKVGVHYCNNKKEFDEERFGSENIKYFKRNLLEFESIKYLIEDFVKEFGGIDILVNNAGFISNYVDWDELTEKEFDDVFNLNVKAPFWLSKNAFRYMKENKNGGRIINMSSINVKNGGSSKSAYYVASKSALETLSRIFSREGAKDNILVNTIRVGIIDSGMNNNVKNYSKTNFNNRLKYVPMGKAGEPIDIANMVLYLAGEKSKFITGQIFTVSGGE